MSVVDEDLARMMDVFTPQPPTVDRWAGWIAVAKIAAVCALALLLFLPPSDAGASDQSFDEWYAQPENREYYEWRTWHDSDPRNRAWFALRVHFGDGRLADQAVRVGECESGLNPRALNRSSGAAGIMQVMPFWAPRFQQVTGVPYYDGRFNPDANARFAAWLVRETGGWSHWVCKP